MILNQILECLKTILKLLPWILIPYFIIAIIISIRPYFVKNNTVICYVGGLGKGKSLLSARKAVQIWKVNKNKVWLYNKFHKTKKQVPKLLSNIPIAVNGKIVSWHPSVSILTGDTKIPEKSVVLIDEISLFCNQWQNEKNNKYMPKVERLITLFRHYTKGGTLIINTQSLSKVNHNIRYCIDQCIEIVEFRHIYKLAWCRVRNLDISNDVVNVNASFAEDNTRCVFLILSSKKRPMYDTYAYSNLYTPQFTDNSYKDNNLKVKDLFALTSTKADDLSPVPEKK